MSNELPTDPVPADKPPTLEPGRRIVSMDQFRGYTVAGMFIVNFLGGMAAVHSVFQHNDNYCSYADTIMPSFMFAAGFSYRLTMLRRISIDGERKAARRAILRSFGLILVSLVIFGFDDEIKRWSDMTTSNIRDFFMRLLKANLWETLAIIGATQLVLLPVIARSFRTRLLTLAAFAVGHVVIAYLFNWNFVNGKPNFVSDFWGVEKTTAWDGGFFGSIAWGIPMLAGSLTYDVVMRRSPGGAALRLLFWGVVTMGIGWGLSCMTRLYDGVPVDDRGNAASPVLPPFENAKGRDWKSLLAEPPFVEPPPPKQRAMNYWMMGKKRVVSTSFTLFVSGYSLALYAIFILACDVGSLRIGVFRTFGQNPLAAYIIHELVMKWIKGLVPKDSELWWCLIGLAVFFGITYFLVKYLEKNKIFLRL